MKLNKNKIYHITILGLLTILCLSNIFILNAINKTLGKPIGAEQYSSIGVTYEVIKNIGRQDGVLFDNIDTINVSFEGKLFKVEKPDMDTVTLISENKPYNIINKEMLEKSIGENRDFFRKDYMLIEGLIYNFYKLEVEKENGGIIDTTDSPAKLEYIEPIDETLIKKYVLLKVNSDYYGEVKYKLTINEIGVVITKLE